jgi:adenosylhomocysteinase
MDVMLRDPALAPDGRRKIEFAARRMPVLEAVRAEFERTRPLRGLRIAACLHVTAETANLCRALARYGTGQNTIDGILRATNLLLAGSVLVVAGYGWCGRGVAMRARGMGARVVVVEVDPIKALEAVMDGLQVLPMAEAAAIGDVFVTVTGNRGVITLDHLKAMKPGAVVCNSGHFDLEIDVAGLAAAAVAATPLRPGAVEYTLAGGKGVVVLAEGRLVGQSCAEASPAEVMDLTFSTQALAVARLASHGQELPAGVHRVPAAIEERVARQKLAALGVRCDQLRDDQRDYLRSWRAGTGA